MTSRLRSGTWKLVLACALATIAALIAASGDYALAHNIPHGSLGTEISVVTPNVLRPSLPSDQSGSYQDKVITTGTQGQQLRPGDDDTQRRAKQDGSDLSGLQQPARDGVSDTPRGAQRPQPPAIDPSVEKRPLGAATDPGGQTILPLPATDPSVEKRPLGAATDPGGQTILPLPAIDPSVEKRPLGAATDPGGQTILPLPAIDPSGQQKPKLHAER